MCVCVHVCMCVFTLHLSPDATSVRSNSPATQTIPLGSALTLDCTYDSLPASTVTWRFNGTVLNTGGTVVINVEGSTSTLTVFIGTNSDAGEYECTAMNTLANGMDTMDSVTFMVTVQGEYYYTHACMHTHRHAYLQTYTCIHARTHTHTWCTCG